MTVETERRRVTYYHVPHAPTSYHTDRFCYWLRDARERGTVVEHERKQLRAGELLECEHVQRAGLKRCPRCGQ